MELLNKPGREQCYLEGVFDELGIYSLVTERCTVKGVSETGTAVSKPGDKITRSRSHDIKMCVGLLVS